MRRPFRDGSARAASTALLPLLLLAWSLLPRPAAAATIHVAPQQSACTPFGGLQGKGTAEEPYTNLYFALTQGRTQCGDTVELHAGTYRVSSRGAEVFPDSTPEERWAQCDDDDHDDGGPSGYDWTRTVLPLLRTCTKDKPLVIQNAPGEQVVLDGTLLDWDRTDLWNPCDSASQCGPVRGLHLTDPTRTFWTTRLTTCGGSPPTACDVQFWVDPSPTSPGKRIGWWANPGWRGAIESPEPADHDRFAEGDLQGTDGQLGGRFFAVAGHVVVMRLSESAARGRFDPAQHAVRVAGVGYQGGVGAVIAARGAHWITVRRNPAGGSFRVRYGYPNIHVSDGASDLLFENLDLEACGGRGYGNCLRTSDGERITLRGGSATDAMGEVVAQYGGGPGCSTNNGCARQLRDCTVEGVTIARGGRAFYDGGGVGVSLGDGVVLKNCENCQAIGNRISDTFARGIRVNISQQKTGCTAAERPDPTSCDWSATDGSRAHGQCTDGRCASDVCENTRAPCSSDGFVVDRNVISNVGHFQDLETGGAPYPAPVIGTDDGGCIWIDTQEGVNHAGRGRVTNNVCRGDYQPARSAPIPGIKLQRITEGPAPGGELLVAHNTISGVNGYCLDAHELTGPVTFFNNLFDDCARAPGMRLPAAVWLDSGIANRHGQNAYSRTATVARVGSGTTVGVDELVGFESTAMTEPAAFVSPTDLHLRCDAPQRGRAMRLPAAGERDVDGDVRPAADAGAWDVGADQARCPR